MTYEIKWNMLVEISIRIFLWCLFRWTEDMEPFIREIHENEVWKYQYPVTLSYVSVTRLWFIIFLLPTIFFAVDYVITNKKQYLIDAFLGITLSYGLTGFVTSFVKVIVGRPRPDFYFRCFPDGKGDDFHACVGESRAYLDGRKSFPSGHSSLSFACMVFISLYLAGKFQLFQNNAKGQTWQLCVCVVPILIATAVAVSRTCDYHHHYEDVIAGSLLGTVISYLCYKLYFRKMSYNGIPSVSSKL